MGVVVPGPAALESLAGLPLAGRAAVLLRRAGCSAVQVVGGGHGGDVGGVLRAHPRTAWVDDRVERPEGGTVLLVAGDVAFSPSLLEELLAEFAAGAGTPVAAVVEGRGLALVGPARAVGPALAGWASSPRDDAPPWERLVPPGTRVSAGAIHASRTPGERLAAVAALVRATRKPADGPLARLFERRISQRITRVLVALPVSPNLVTTASLVVGLVGAALLATTDHRWRAIGAAAFVLAAILDGCDGEVARTKLLESEFGRLYDTGVDVTVNAAVFLGIGVGIWRELYAVSEVENATLLLVGGGLFAMTVVESVRRVAPIARAREGLPGRAGVWLETFATLEWCYLVLGLALFDQLPFFFFGAAVGTNVFALVYLSLGVLAWRRA